MELLLSVDQQMLLDSAGKALERAGGVKRARKLRNVGGGFDRAMHRELAAQGWYGILVPAERGGLGLGASELALVLQEVGRTLAPEPVAGAALAAWAVAVGGASKAHDDLLTAILGGEKIVVPALQGGRDGTEPGDSALRAVLGPSGVKLAGTRGFVASAEQCDGFLVSAAGAKGPVLAYVERGAKGLGLASTATVDGRPHGRLECSDVAAMPIAVETGTAGALVERLYNLSLVAASAELLGVMSAVQDLTVDYLKTRKQFGRLIGSFQALQHRAVDSYSLISGTQSLLFQVAAQGSRITPAMASALKAYASDAGLTVTKSAIQMHGAIGFTDEHDAGLYLKRAMWLSATLGNAAAHRKRFAMVSAARND